VKDSVGGHAGDPLLLLPWQKKVLGALFARRPDGKLRHRTGIIGLPRKNGKSALGSGIGLYGLMLGPNGGEIYSCAADRDQARIVFGSARQMVERSPELVEVTKVYRDAIENVQTGSVYRVLSSEAFTKEGLSPTLVIYDELHAAPNDDLWNVMSLAQAARVDALVLGITTAGVRTDSSGQDSVCYRLFQYGSRIAAGEQDDPSFFMAWWQAGPDADHRDPKSWMIANPGFGTLQDPEDFDSAVRRTPENEFRTKRMNQWVASSTAWLPAGAWDSLERCDIPGPDIPVVLFVDGSFSGDSTFIAGCTVEPKPRIFKVAAWEKQPEDSDEWRVEISEVETAVIEACKKFRVVEVPFDPFRWQRSMQVLAESGIPIVEYPTSSPARMVPSCAKFFDAVMSNGLSHDHDPQLSRHIANAVVKTDRLGPRIVKENRWSLRKIDGAVCAVGAFDRATMYREAPKPSVPMFFS
jgi:phage terminase large subunit-like protein